MTHDEAEALLPVYALGALDDDVAALEAHLRGCARCAALLGSYQETTATLGEAVEQVAPPASLRASVLAHVPASVAEASPRASRSSFSILPSLFSSSPRSLARSRVLPLAAALLLFVGLAAGNVVQRQQLQAAQAELALDQLGLALLTSTETSVERLAPVANPTGPEHGHWYHRPGIQTEVVVVEFMPALPPGQAYYGWLKHANGSWQSVGRFMLDSSGHGRVILTGSDGSDVRGVVVTRQLQPTAAPSSEVVLRWAAP